MVGILRYGTQPNFFKATGMQLLLSIFLAMVKVKDFQGTSRHRMK
jgi:hypothetical protein